MRRAWWRASVARPAATARIRYVTLAALRRAFRVRLSWCPQRGSTPATARFLLPMPQSSRRSGPQVEAVEGVGERLESPDVPVEATPRSHRPMPLRALPWSTSLLEVEAEEAWGKREFAEPPENRGEAIHRSRTSTRRPAESSNTPAQKHRATAAAACTRADNSSTVRCVFSSRSTGLQNEGQSPCRRYGRSAIPPVSKSRRSPRSGRLCCGQNLLPATAGVTGQRHGRTGRRGLRRFLQGFIRVYSTDHRTAFR